MRFVGGLHGTCTGAAAQVGSPVRGGGVVGGKWEGEAWA